MFVKDLKLNYFRNIENEIINPSEHINYFVGNNAQGKTNIVESIYYISLLKSFRTNNSIDLIKYGNERFSIEANINNNIRNNIKIFYDRKKSRNILINNKKPEKYQFFKLLTCFLFFNDEINYLKFYPSYRRNFIDRSIFNLNKNYLDIIKNYNKCLKQRNAFLKNIRSSDIWVEQLIEYGSLVVRERSDYIKRLNKELSYKKFTEKYSVNYSFLDVQDIKSSLSKKFEKNKEKERKYGYTLFGPHTDDFIFLINNSDFRKYSSEGQKLSFLLNLKYSQLVDYEKNTDQLPVLIFDDIGKELDSHRKSEIFSNFFDKNCQTFITSTNIDYFSDNSKIFNVENGQFSELNQG